MNQQHHFELKPIDASRFPEVVSVWEASVSATHDFLSAADIQKLKPSVLRDYLPAVEHLVGALDQQGSIVGFIGVQQKMVEMLFLAPAVFGFGLGKILLNHAIATWHVDCVDVNEQNPKALAFYQHMGFEVVGRSACDAQGQPFPLLHMKLKR